jgi:hypothetical protein
VGVEGLHDERCIAGRATSWLRFVFYSVVVDTDTLECSYYKGGVAWSVCCI